MTETERDNDRCKHQYPQPAGGNGQWCPECGAIERNGAYSGRTWELPAFTEAALASNDAPKEKFCYRCGAEQPGNHRGYCPLPNVQRRKSADTPTTEPECNHEFTGTVCGVCSENARFDALNAEQEGSES